MQREAVKLVASDPDAEIKVVADLPAHDGRGVSMRQLETLLPEYELVSARSYAFFGELISDLPPSYQKAERMLAAECAMNGSQISGIWIKKGKA